MNSWKTIKVETQAKVYKLYRWEQEKLKDSQFNFIGAYILYGYQNDILYAGITKTRDVGLRVREHLNDTGVTAADYLCKQLDHVTGNFNGYDTGYENYVYRIEIYEFKKKETHIWFEKFLIKENNPPCNFDERTDLVATAKLNRLIEWDTKREAYFKKSPSMDSWSTFEQEAVKTKRRIEECVLKEVARKMGHEYPYFYSNELSNLPNSNYFSEDEFIEELIKELDESKGQTYKKEQIYQLALKIGLSGNASERFRLGIQVGNQISELIP